MARLGRFLIIGGSAGFLCGFGLAVHAALANRYFHYRLWRTFLGQAAGATTRGALLGGLAGSLVFGLVVGIRRRNRERAAVRPERTSVMKKHGPAKVLLAVPILMIWSAFLTEALLSSGPRWRSFLLKTLVLGLCWFALVPLWVRAARWGRALRLFALRPLALRGLGILLLGALAGLHGAHLFFGLSRSPRSPNVLIIVADALRADSLGCYGDQTPETPHLDKLAAEGILFEKAWSSAPWTKPAIASLLTGLLPQEHLAKNWPDSLGVQCLTIAERLRDSGYHTLGLQTNPSISAAFDFDQGFEDYGDLTLQPGPRIVEAFRSWLKDRPGGPYLAYVHLMDTHFPYGAAQEIENRFDLRRQPKSSGRGFETIDIRILDVIGKNESDRAFLAGLYEKSVRSVDDILASILELAEEESSGRGTVIVFTADHGEEFWEHGGFAHGHSLYNELLRIPLIVKFGSLGRGVRISQDVQLPQVPLLIEQICRLRRDHVGDGEFHSLVAKMLSDRRPLLFGATLFGPTKSAVVGSGWKLIRNSDERSPFNPLPLGDLTRYVYPRYQRSFELYDLANDPGEQHNVIAERRDIARRLEAEMIRYFGMGGASELPSKKISKEKEEQLRSLGYIR